MAFAIVLSTDDFSTDEGQDRELERELKGRGYYLQTVWIKRVVDKSSEEQELRKLNVPHFLVSDSWARSNE